MDDVNNGPGKELFENYMLGMDITSELLGNTYYYDTIFSHLLDLQDNFTVVLDDFVEGVLNKKVLLDRILMSPSLRPSVTSRSLEYQKYNILVDNAQRRDGGPTDHSPVALNLDLI